MSAHKQIVFHCDRCAVDTWIPTGEDVETLCKSCNHTKGRYEVWDTDVTRKGTYESMSVRFDMHYPVPYWSCHKALTKLVNGLQKALPNFIIQNFTVDLASDISTGNYQTPGPVDGE